MKGKNKDFIKVEILETKPIGFYISDNKFGTEEMLDKDDVEFKIHMQILTNTENETFKIILSVDCHLVKTNRKKEKGIFGIKSSTIFHVPNFADFTKNKKKLNFPTDFLIKLLNICIGGIRGMLSTNLINTQYKNLTLPLVDLSKFEKQKI